MEGLRVEQRDGAVLVAIDGKITMERIPDITREVEQATRGDDPRLDLDLSGVRFIDSSGIGFLVSLSTRTASAGKTLELVNPSPQVTKTLELVQLLRFFRIRRPDDETAQTA